MRAGVRANHDVLVGFLALLDNAPAVLGEEILARIHESFYVAASHAYLTRERTRRDERINASNACLDPRVTDASRVHRANASLDMLWCVNTSEDTSCHVFTRSHQ